jgi:hypothetical protein
MKLSGFTWGNLIFAWNPTDTAERRRLSKRVRDFAMDPKKAGKIRAWIGELSEDRWYFGGDETGRSWSDQRYRPAVALVAAVFHDHWWPAATVPRLLDDAAEKWRGRLRARTFTLADMDAIILRLERYLKPIDAHSGQSNKPPVNILTQGTWSTPMMKRDIMMKVGVDSYKKFRTCEKIGTYETRRAGDGSNRQLWQIRLDTLDPRIAARFGGTATGK